MRLAAVLGMLLSMLTPALPVPSAAAQSVCSAPPNPIVAENCLPGNDASTGDPATEWDLNGVDTSAIEGFATNISVNRGTAVSFKVKTTAASYALDVYRVGYYGGKGARKLTASPIVGAVSSQPACITQADTGLIDCGNWSVSASWNVPAAATSGVHFAKLRRTDGTPGVNHIYFVVRDDASTADLHFQTSDPTWQAYNSYGGKSLYDGLPNGTPRAYKVSYNRPFITRIGQARSFLWNSEYPMIRWLESNGFNVTYASGVDTDRFGSARLLQRKVFLSVGHDEYWSGGQRAAVEAARDGGMDLAFFSGNEVYQKTRWEPSADGSETPYRTLVTYKETQANAKIDPTAAWTGTWRDPRFSPPADGGRPENGLTGTIFTVQAYDQVPNEETRINVPAADGKMRLWRNVRVDPAVPAKKFADMVPGEIANLAMGLLGFEFDEDLDNGARPAGLIRLSSSSRVVGQKLIDFGANVAPGTATHSMTLYKAPSGALVFGAGTIQWAWGLDANHDRAGSSFPADTRVQQATVNLLADMGVQPATLQTQGGLVVAATASTDAAAPTSVITGVAPLDAQGKAQTGALVTISGTATDAGGGAVGGVEVSTDNGATWHPATGRGSWTYTWTPTQVGDFTVKTRAADDSGNRETPGAGTVVPVRLRDCPCSLWNDAATPVVPAFNDNGGIEVGLRFRSDVNGYATGLRFYKGPGNTGAHYGHLWDNNGNKLAEVGFAGETASGWQTATLTPPVALTANTTYVASYYAPNGHYAGDGGYFAASGRDNLPLHALQDGPGTPQGSFRYTSNPTGIFPDLAFNATNYWVDVVFNTTLPPDTTPPTIAARSPAAGATDGGLGRVTATFDESVRNTAQDPILFTLTGPNNTPVSGAVTYDNASRTATFTPSALLQMGTAYSASVRATDQAGNQMTAPVVWSFTTATCPCSLWPDTATPAIPSIGSSNPIELGLRFQPSVNGFATGVRFYKGPANTGAHRGRLWTNTGTQLAEVNFVNESASGWQTALFSSPVAVTAGTLYVVSYFAPNGGYAADGAYFAASGRESGPLFAPQHSASVPQGSFIEGSNGGFPSLAFNATNYWVDVVFSTTAAPDTAPPTISARTPAPGATDGGLSRVTATFNESVRNTAQDPIQFTLTGPGGAAVAGTITYDDPTRTATFTANAPLAPATAYSASVRATDLAGNQMTAPVVWSFTTATCPCSLWPDTATPTIVTVGSSNPIELGLRFRPIVNGYATGVRFYKGPQNTGTHRGRLWDNFGNQLAEVTFANETATGWQQASFTPPVALTAGTTYVASYFAPNGNYSADGNYFTVGRERGPLFALAHGVDGPQGSYVEGSNGGFPINAFNATNYWVDVVFDTTAPADTTPPTVLSKSPAPGATDGGLTRVTATFSEGVRNTAQDPIIFTVTGPGGAAVAGTISYDAASRTAAFTPNPALLFATTYNASVRATDLSGNAMSAPVTWSFTTATCPCTIWTAADAPTTASISDHTPIELGLRFSPTVDGYISGIRFYKGVNNTGTHVGNLWTNTGAPLGSATFTTETATGWQQVNFPAPVRVTAGNIYVASYYAPVGGYAADGGYFLVNGRERGPLVAPAHSASTPQGSFTYNGGFPISSFNATNYWVDTVYAPFGGSSGFDVRMTSPTHGSNLPASATPTLAADVVDSVGGGISHVRFEIFNGTTWSQVGGLDTLPPYTATVSAPLANGTYRARATATYADTMESTSQEVTFTVGPVNLTVQIGGAPATSAEGSAVALTSTVTGQGPSDTLTYAWTVTKDGAAFASGSAASLTFTPNDNGTYVVALTATANGTGPSGSDSETIAVTNVAPTAAIGGAPATSPEGTAVSLTASATDPSAADTSAGFTYGWSATKNGAAFASGTGSSFSFTPDDNGAYVVSLTATDKDSAASAPATATINVTNVVPTVALVGAPTGIGLEGTEVPFTSTVTDPSAADTSAGFTYAWSVTKNGAAYATGSAAAFAFTPNDNGTYVVTLTATDKNGGAGSASKTVEVINLVPTVHITDLRPPPIGATETVSMNSTATDPSSIDTAAGLPRTWTVTRNGTTYATGTANSFSFVPDIAGDYTVTLTAVDKDGGVSGPDSLIINVVDYYPVVSIEGPSTGSEGSAIALTSSVTNTLPGSSASYAWSVKKNGVAYGSNGSGTNYSFTPNDNGSYVVTLAVTAGGRTGSGTKTITVGNVAPTVAINGAPATGTVGTAIALTSTVTDPSTADTSAGLTLAWNVTRDGSAFATGSGAGFSFTPSASGIYVVTLTATDKDGGNASDSDTINVAGGMTVAIGGIPASPVEGSAISLTSTLTGAPGGSTPTYAWSVKKNGVAYGSNGSAATYSFTPTDNATYAVTLTATAGGLTATDTESIVVANVKPSGLTRNLSQATLNEAATVTLSGAFVDPGTLDTHTITINWGDGSANTVLNLAAGVLTYSTPHTYLDDNPTNSSSDTNVITVTVADKDGGTVSGTKNIALYNSPPVVVSLSAPTTPVHLNTLATATVRFTDLGTPDTHTATFNWGDGSTTSGGTVVEPSGSTPGSITDRHAYTAPGTYTLKVTVKDDDTGTDNETFRYIVVYDPTAGWTAGAGLVQSAKGTYPSKPDQSGTAFFGFVSAYLNPAARTPTGLTVFDVKMKHVDFEFYSVSYDWLVVNGAKATYRGTGKVGNTSGYGFLLSVIDGAKAGTGVDKFRIKIFTTASCTNLNDTATCTTFYDSQPGAPDDADPTTSISAGIIAIID